jgi:hypothetical protein
MSKYLTTHWWFRHRHTGDITVAQVPNWPLYAIGALWVARRLVDSGGSAYSVMGWASTGLWLFWGLDEIVRGVNPWRKLLGAVVVSWQLFSVLT